jgi:Flp pilus assembly protein TadG
MKFCLMSLGRKALKEESGQVFVITGLGALLLVGLAGIAVEVGHGYYALELLQASTNSATMAAAAGLPSSATATAYAIDYSSKANQENAISILQNATVTVTPFCSTTVQNDYNVPCISSTGSGTGYNAVTVVQTAQSGLWIGKMFGTPLFNLKAVGTAAMSGGNPIPYNVALIMDTTGSMGQPDTSGDCTGSSNTSETCALQGFRAALQTAYPCEAGQTCTSTSATPDDAISLFVFPTAVASTISHDTTCPTGTPTTDHYHLPTVASTDTYQVVPFSSGHTYRTSDTAASLNSGDLLVNAAGGPTGGCGGLGTPGGSGTYYAQVIYAAGQALQAEQAARPGTSNLMILLTDGNATATMQYTKSGSTITGIDPANSEIQPTNGIVSGGTYGSVNGTKYPGWSGQQNISTYPSGIGQCGQAVQAANDVATKQTVTYTTLDGGSTTFTLNNGTDATKYTQVYTIAYESPNASTGSGNSSADPESSTSSEACYTDIAYNVNNNYWTACGYSVSPTATPPCTQSVTTGGGSWPTPTSGEGSIAAYSPCAAIAAMASNANNFFSDNASHCLATTTANQGITSMTQIFTKIFGSLLAPKLIPNGSA